MRSPVRSSLKVTFFGGLGILFLVDSHKFSYTDRYLQSMGVNKAPRLSAGLRGDPIPPHFHSNPHVY